MKKLDHSGNTHLSLIMFKYILTTVPFKGLSPAFEDSKEPSHEKMLQKVIHH
jgi:hypothetical protein